MSFKSQGPAGTHAERLKFTNPCNLEDTKNVLQIAGVPCHQIPPSQRSAQSFSPANHQLDNFLISSLTTLTSSTPRSLPFPFNSRHVCLSLAHYRHGHYDTIDLLAERIHAKSQYPAVAASPLVNSISLPERDILDL
jgi:hypothetical protein